MGSAPLDVCTVSVYTPDRYMAALSPTNVQRSEKLFTKQSVDNGEHSLELYLDF